MSFSRIITRSSDGAGMTSLMASLTLFIHGASKLVSFSPFHMGLQKFSKSLVISAGLASKGPLVGSVYTNLMLSGSFLMTFLQCLIFFTCSWLILFFELE